VLDDSNSRTDGHLIAEALAGQPEAFGELVRRYQDRLFHSVVRVTGCPVEAEDVVQDAFVQAYTKLDRFKGESQFFTWLYRIAFNTSVSRHRKKKPTVSIDKQREAIGDNLPDGQPPVEAALERDEQVRQLEAALLELPEDQRTILVLRELEDQSYDEIAAILDLPAGTVRSRLHRARKQLHELLKTRHEQFF
jgi:RNA polymerase sigma-70 factor (ECF subfamily)